MNYYNEIDPKKAAWLRELIESGVVADGEVDERSIEDVVPTELAGYTQCHFFAGIGLWSYALRFAGWPDDRPVWTGSCPCQSFSSAGKRAGFDDERHLWPAWFHLIEQCRPDRIFGEQVGAAIGHGWLDLVHDDLEAVGYALGSVVLPACSVGAPHIRQRLWIVAQSSGTERGQGRSGRSGEAGSGTHAKPSGSGDTGLVAHAEQRPAERHGPELAAEASGVQGEARERQRLRDDVGDGGVELGHASGPGPQGRDRSDDVELHGGPEQARPVAATGVPREVALVDSAGSGFMGPIHPGERGEGGGPRKPAGTMSPWSDCEWLPCTDGKARPVKPGLEPLVDGAPERVLRLRGYGDGIVPQVAAEVILASMEVR